MQFSSSDNAWHIGQTAFAVGSAFARERNFVVPALPYLRRLRDQTRESANLGVVESGEIVLVNQVPSPEIMPAISPVGGRAPMTASGMGILASYTRVDVDAVLRRHGMRRATCKTLTSRDALDAQLADARREGYSVDDEEFVTGLRCVAAPVYDDKADVAFAVSVSGLPLRMTTERIPRARPPGREDRPRDHHGARGQAAGPLERSPTRQGRLGRSRVLELPRYLNHRTIPSDWISL